MPENEKPVRPRFSLAHFLVFVGIVCIATGVAWKRIVPLSSFWSEQQAADYDDAFAIAHEASIGHGHSHGVSSGPAEALSVEEAKARFQEAKERLARARNAREHTGQYLTMLGVALSVAGVLALRRKLSL